jgi:hypothetical protein
MNPVPSVRAVRMVTTEGRERAAMSAGVSARAGAATLGWAGGAGARDTHPSNTDAATAHVAHTERRIETV